MKKVVEFFLISILLLLITAAWVVGNAFETLKSPLFSGLSEYSSKSQFVLVGSTHSKRYKKTYFGSSFLGWLHLLSLKAFLDMGDSPLFHSMGMHEHTDVKARLPLELHHHSA